MGGVGIVILIIIIVVAVVVSKKNSGGGGDDSSSDNGGPGSSNLDGQDRNEIPDKWKNTYLDPWFWKSTTDFNTTFTDQMVGGLPVMGLFSEWDDSARANDNVPPLNKNWGSYKDKPARGVNLGGWLSLEPFITPSLFDYPSDQGIIDEWSLCQKLGGKAAGVLEEHYASFVTEETIKEIADAGLDHLRIPFSYWAVEIYDGDPYVFRTSWRYLLRGIEWARKYGLRVKLDVHGLPGSQNGWNHSGRLGAIGWLNGTDGKLNADRSLDMHDKLSKFFAQDRYKNIISHYGLANEPRMVELKSSDVIQWTETAYKKVRDNGVDALVVFGDGFMGLENWQGLMTGYDDMVLDVHQYVIFNEQQIAFTHQEKVEYACKGWTEQAELSMDRTRGYGPTMFAEWSQADTDCAPYLNHGMSGSRWEGSLASVDGPKCPTGNDRCSCNVANAGPDKWSDQYKKFLQMFAEAQMYSFEKGWGWWYWTWKTENAPLWSYEAGLKAGILPKKAYDRDFNCDSDVPDFAKEGLPEYY
jgi:glucan 1,3-beta-glucosidase